MNGKAEPETTGAAVATITIRAAIGAKFMGEILASRAPPAEVEGERQAGLSAGVSCPHKEMLY